jgi:ParB-like chromosome segregation protein Spo0J
MYEGELTEVTLPIDQIFLDPNNPRFWNESEERVPPEMVSDDDIQARTASRIRDYNLEPLYHSILRNGFLPIDRIVVRNLPVEQAESSYVVVEGNRRLAALKLLRRKIVNKTVDAEQIDADELQAIVDNTNELNVLLYEGDEEDVAWTLQGVRHISGVEDWPPAQKGRLVAKRIDEQGMLYSAAGQKFGLSAREVGRLYRGYKALQQMKDDDEYGDKAENTHFTILQEAWKNRSVRDWLEWDSDNNAGFQDRSNLRQFYSWILPDPDNEYQKRRLKNDTDVRTLAKLLEGDTSDLLGKVDRHELTIEEAKAKFDVRQITEEDWRGPINDALGQLKNIPAPALAEGSEELGAKLQEVKQLVTKYLRMLQ